MSDLFVTIKQGDPGALHDLIAAGAEVNTRHPDPDQGGRFPLMSAAESGHIDCLRILLQAGASPGAKDHRGCTALFYASRAGWAPATAALLEAGANPNAHDRMGSTALLQAVEAGHSDIVRMLLQAGASVHAREGLNSTALHLAARQGDAQIIRLLVKAGADLEAQNGMGTTPLIDAVVAGHLQAVRTLLELGANIHIKVYGMSLPVLARQQKRPEIARFLYQAREECRARSRPFAPLWEAARQGQIETVQQFLETGLSPNTPDKENGSRTALMYAAEYGHAAVVDALVSAGVRLNLKDRAPYTITRHRPGINYQADVNGGRTALMMAAANGHTDVVQRLLKAGARVNARDSRRRSALIYAAAAAHTAVVDLLIKARANVNARDEDGATPLLEAVCASDARNATLVQEVNVLACNGAGSELKPGPGAALQVARLLLDAGAQPDVRDGDGFWPLKCAAAFGNTSLVQLLIKAGADLARRDEYGITTLLAAAGAGQDAVAAALLQAGADPNDVDGSGCTALAYTAAKGSLALARHLLQAGARIQSRGKCQTRPLCVAVENGHLKMARLLIQSGAPVNPPVPAPTGSASNKMSQEITGKQQATSEQAPLVRAVYATFSGPKAEAMHVKLLQTLLKAGADPNIPDSTGETALLAVARLGRMALVPLLLKAGANPELREKEYHRTPLMLAAQSGYEEIVSALLAGGANLDARDRWDNTALSLAEDADQAGTASLLRQAGAVDGSGGKALRQAVEAGDLQEVRRLINSGVDIHARDTGGRTALLLAAAFRHTEIVHLLQQAGAHSDPVIAAFLEVLEFPRLTANRDFQAAVMELKEICGVEPEPAFHLDGGWRFTINVTEEEQALRSRGVSEYLAGHQAAENIIRRLLTRLRAQYLDRGYTLFGWKFHPLAPYCLALFPTTNKYAVMAAVGVNAVNYEMGTPEIIDWLQEMEKDHPFALTFCGYDLIEGDFLTPIREHHTLARRMVDFCPDQVSESVDTVSKLAKHLRQTQRLYLWWD